MSSPPVYPLSPSQAPPPPFPPVQSGHRIDELTPGLATLFHHLSLTSHPLCLLPVPSPSPTLPLFPSVEKREHLERGAPSWRGGMPVPGHLSGGCRTGGEISALTSSSLTASCAHPSFRDQQAPLSVNRSFVS